MATDVSEDRLADLALDAAIEAEELISGQVTTRQALNVLKEALSRAAGLNGNGDARCAYLSPGEVNVLSRALHEFGSHDARPTTDLISDLQGVLRALDASQQTLDVPTLQKIVNFCAALCDELSLRAQAISNARKPVNPYRRYAD